MQYADAMKGTCPRCKEIRYRRISAKTLKNGKERMYLSYVHTDKPGKLGGMVLTHYIGICKSLSSVRSLGELIDPNY